MVKHLVIAGHGKRRNGTFDPGATGFISKGEHRYVKEDLFPAMKKHLPKNHDVIFFDRYNVYDYGNIVSLARQYGADEVTEIHFDAASPSASGGHVIVYSGYSPDKTDLAFRDAIDKMVGVRYSHKGYKGISGRSNLANVNRTASAGITYRMLELGFGTNRKDAGVLTSKVDEYAKELVKVLGYEGGLTVSQYNELKNEIKRLERALGDKLDKPSAYDSKTPTSDHKDNVEQAKALGISNGANPRKYATREQTMSMVVNAYNKAYPDLEEAGISHQEAVEWAVENDIFNGEDLHHPATRQQVATMIKRAVDYIEGGDKIKEQ